MACSVVVKASRYLEVLSVSLYRNSYYVLWVLVYYMSWKRVRVFCCTICVSTRSNHKFNSCQQLVLLNVTLTAAVSSSSCYARCLTPWRRRRRCRCCRHRAIFVLFSGCLAMRARSCAATVSTRSSASWPSSFRSSWRPTARWTRAACCASPSTTSARTSVRIHVHAWLLYGAGRTVTSFAVCLSVDCLRWSWRLCVWRARCFVGIRLCNPLSRTALNLACKLRITH